MWVCRKDGYQVIQQIKARPALERTRLVILSRRDGVLDRLKGRLVGAHAYLTRPFKTDRLLVVIQAVLGNAAPGTEDATAHSHVSEGGFPLRVWHIDEDRVSWARLQKEKTS